MKLKDSFVTCDMDEQMVMISSDASVFSGMLKGNKTTAFIIEMLKEETDRESIINAMLEKYDAPKEKISADVDKVIEALKKINAVSV